MDIKNNGNENLDTILSKYTLQQVRQGDILLTRVKHSEHTTFRSENNIILSTSNNHKLVGDGEVWLVPPNSVDVDKPVIGYILVQKQGAELIHDGHHKPIHLNPGLYEVRRQRQMIGARARIVAD